MEQVLQEIIQARLGEEKKLGEQAGVMITAACHSEEALAAALGGETIPGETQPRSETVDGRYPALLQSIRVEGFRGVGPEATLEISPGPGLTLVVGRNGSGKSSFAEALELLLTGSNSRWSTRSAIWKEGWRNLHHSDARIDAEFVLEGSKGTTLISRSWAPGAKLEEAETLVTGSGSEASTIDDLGWAAAVEMYRPFLSYSELGSMLDAGPSALYDALSAILGLEDLVVAEGRLKEAAKQRKKLGDDAKSSLAPLLERLGEIEDERARACLEALSGKTWNLDTVERSVIGPEYSLQEETEGAALRQLSTLEGPSADEVAIAAEGLEAASAAIAQFGGTEAQKALQTAELLESALRFHADHGDQDCPVCGKGELDRTWRDETENEVARLRTVAEQADLAHRLRDEAMKSAKSLMLAPPSLLSSASALGISVDDLMSAWKSWTTGASLDDAEPLAEHLRTAHASLVREIEAVRDAAAKELQTREDIWRPVAAELAAWLDDARQAQRGEAQLDDLRAAEKWLRAASAEVRNERFAPIADLAQSVWETLRMQSNVELKKIVLTGAGSARKVVLEVTVDGMEGAALGVMSQGELNSLALSLFMPRATLPESPFRFVVIDDPVQSMDPARVDGLARVLQNAARSRQVVVFTHDDRLARSCRLLGIDAKMVEVTRRAESVVELRPGLDPVGRYCADAWAIANSEDIDAAVVSRVVGVFCRSAIEAACADAITRRRLAAGEDYAAIEALLDSTKGLAPLLALALFDDMSRTKDVVSRLDKGIGRWAVSAYRGVQDASHKPVARDVLLNLVRDSERLARGLVQLP
ncbi:MAG TPA: AAA family ATPase [Actinomycetota bacterium]|jgi:DNA repair exonuclease SbcCD ATPase subunit|nr:AAA family ATPase [Actinomycetota bacterium]